MATKAKPKKPTSKPSGSAGDFYIPPLSLDVAVPDKPLAESMMGWIFGTVLIGLLLPLLGFLYVDILTAKRDVEIELAKVQQLRRQMELEKREK